MTHPAPWEMWLKARYLPYLLPAAMHQAVPVEVAARFMKRLTGEEEGLLLLRWRSLLASRRDRLLALIEEDLPALCRVLPSRSEVEVHHDRGGFRGRPDLVSTHRLRLRGDQETFVSRGRRREFDLPEVVLVRWVVERLLDGIATLRKHGMSGYEPLAAVADQAGPLRNLLERTPLRQVMSVDRLGPAHRQAADAARNAVFHEMSGWAHQIEVALDGEDPQAIARLLSEGALTAVREEKRFELAVFLRLAEALGQALRADEPDSGWRWEFGLLDAGRSHLLAISHASSDTHVRLLYDQAVLPRGPRDQAATWYFGTRGRLRPDWTLAVERAGRPLRHVVGEVKLTTDTAYAIHGFQEAMLYAEEYRPWLTGWPTAVLTTTAPIVGAPDRRQGVVAENWDTWPSAVTVEGILDGVLAP